MGALNLHKLFVTTLSLTGIEKGFLSPNRFQGSLLPKLRHGRLKPTVLSPVKFGAKPLCKKAHNFFFSQIVKCFFKNDHYFSNFSETSFAKSTVLPVT